MAELSYLAFIDITINCLLQALGLYIFVLSFRRAYKRKAFYPRRGFITGKGVIF